MREVIIGDFVETTHGINGILIDIKEVYYSKSHCYLVMSIATADGRIFNCPVNDLKNCIYKMGDINE